jgi:molybdate transport system substrate-binding protein
VNPARTPALLLLFVLLAIAPAQAQAPAHVSLYASGTLHVALAEIAKNFTQQTGIVVDQTYGASPQLRERIEAGATADVFASADTVNPVRLQREGKSGPVTTFAHNRMCLLVKPFVAGTRKADDLIIDQSVRLITALPVRDSAGDYAEAVFARIDDHQLGAMPYLDAKALRLFGSPDVPIPAGADPGAYLLLTANRGDAFLGWCTAAEASVATNPTRLQSLEMPPSIAVTANYGLTLRNGAPVEAELLRAFILSGPSQVILEKYGFGRV